MSICSDFLKEDVKFSVFADWWIESYCEKQLKERTIERYTQFKKRTYDAFGETPIKSIRALDIQVFIDSLANEGVNNRTGGGLSPKTICGYLGFVSDVMKYAWRLELIDANPCSRVIAPKITSKERVIYSEEQTQEFLYLLKDAPTQYQVFYQIAIFAGLRRGELLGLDWTDIDFKNSIIKVRKNSQYTKRKGMYSDKPKSLAGQRVLKLPQFLFASISRLRHEQVADFSAKEITWSEFTRLFTSEGGEPMHPNVPYNWLKRFCQKREIPFYGIHQFRHLNASLLIYTGADPTTVAHTLGHSKVSTTMNIYSHAFAYAQAMASSAVSDVLVQRLSAKVPAHYF